jgi:hypothetical protein
MHGLEQTLKHLTLRSQVTGFTYPCERSQGTLHCDPDNLYL